MKINAYKYTIILFFISLISCFSQDSKSIELIKAPESFENIDEAEGDLDKDGIAEKVIVYNTKKETDFGTERQIYIYKKNKNNWELWKKSIGAVQPSEHGGMGSNSFEDILIERNCIVIHHFGGLRQKWSYTHRFRYQNDDFYLIGATVNFGSNCDYWENFDYNLSTGIIKYEKETENCQKETSKIKKKEINRKLKTLPKMNGFYPGDNKIKFPNSEIIMYY